MTETANIVDEFLVLSLTEWEFDVLGKSVQKCAFPGTHVDLAHKLIEKMKAKEIEARKPKKK